MKSGGFTLPSNAKVHILALGGGGEKGMSDNGSEMFAYGWIIDADTRQLVWKMERSNTRSEKGDRKFDDLIDLRKGSYEAYFAAYSFISKSGFTNFNFNIDRRKDNLPHTRTKKDWFFSWFENFFGKDADKEWKRRSKNWYIEVYADDNVGDVKLFDPPKGFPNALYKATRLGENEHIKQGFVLSAPIPIRVYALGEENTGDELADYGWIVDAKTHKRIWAMRRSASHEACGARKNIKFDDVVAFPSGEYILYFTTDDSHSYLDWNAAPPCDPFNYGISLIAAEEKDKTAFSLTTPKENQNVIVQLTQLGDDQNRSASITLKKATRLHVYAIGERSNSHRQMADYGWIINTRTREKVWTMDVDRTEHAGGAEKNRMIDEDVSLPKGTYTVYFQTDDSHSYDDWNSSPPFDPEHWGITVTGAEKDFEMSCVEANVTPKDANIIAQIVEIGNNAKKVLSFNLDKPTRVRIYAIGEGQNREMFDYGWIEDAKSSKVIWEMTFSMTFHAGGERKNRMVNTTLLLDKGEYELHYDSDDSHSYNDWNADPPDDPSMWGITIYKEE